MLDITLFRKNPGIIDDMLRKRSVNYSIEQLLTLDKNRRGLITENQKLKREKNITAQEIAYLRKQGEDTDDKVTQMKSVTDRISISDVYIKKEGAKFRELIMRFPNIPHDSVPIAKDEKGNLEIRNWGKLPDHDFEPKDHIDLGLNLNLIDLERAAKVAGSRFYFLRDDLVKMNYALIQFSLDFLAKKGFTVVQPPYMLKKSAIEGGIVLSDFEDVIYKVEGEDLYLIGTSEHAILAMHMGEIFDGNNLPIRYAGVSPCFRKEAGAHGRDTKGIFRVHQFEKIEQFIFCKPESSWDEFETLIRYSEEMFQLLQIPYRIMVLSTGDMGTMASKTYDLEAWLPGQKAFRELVSCSNCTDFQSRTLGIKYRAKPHEDSILVHTLNSTLVATERTMIAIMENYQRENGNIGIPDVLQQYMGGISEITRPKKK